MEDNKTGISIEEIIEFGIKHTDGDDPYSAGMRNGMRWVLSCINGDTPNFEDCPPYGYSYTSNTEEV